MNKKQLTSPSPSPSKTTKSAGSEIEVISLMKRHYHAIRMRLSDPYTAGHEVFGIMCELNLLPPQLGLSEIVRALTSENFKLRDRLITNSRNVFFPLLVRNEVEKHHHIMDLIKAEMIGEDRF